MPDQKLELGHLSKRPRSVSQYNTFTRCGEQYRLQKVERVLETPAAWLAQGTAFHAAIEQWEKSARVLTVEATVKIGMDEYVRLIESMRVKWPEVSEWLCGPRTTPEKDIMARAKRVADQIRGYTDYALSQPFEIWELPDGSPALEVPFDMELSNGIHVIGFIDQIIEWPDGTVMPRDLKTGTKLPDDEFQLATYARAIEYLFDQPIALGDYFMAKNNAATAPYDLSVYTPDLLSSMYGALDTGVEAGVFLPRKGDHCRVCAVRYACRLFSAS